eukprot:12913989-Prorocentrum_lima.AAC.1
MQRFESRGVGEKLEGGVRDQLGCFFLEEQDSGSSYMLELGFEMRSLPQTFGGGGCEVAGGGH